MVTIYRSRQITDRILANLTTAAILVGDGVKPAIGGWVGAAGVSNYNGYVVLHPMAGGDLDGPIGDPDADAEARYQVSAFGSSRAQAELMADKARTVMLGTPVVADGRTVMRMTVTLLGGSARDDESDPPIWMAVDRYSAYSTPA